MVVRRETAPEPETAEATALLPEAKAFWLPEPLAKAPWFPEPTEDTVPDPAARLLKAWLKLEKKSLGNYVAARMATSANLLSLAQSEELTTPCQIWLQGC